MKKDELIQAIEGLVYVYINNKDGYGEFAKIRLNPVLLTVDLETAEEFQDELADSEYAMEAAAAGVGDEAVNADDYQVAQDPVFIEVKSIIKDGKPDAEAIGKLAEQAIRRAAHNHIIEP